MSKYEKVCELANAAAIYVPFDAEGMRIIAVVVEDGCFYAEGEESGEDYRIEFEDVDLEQDMFYKLTLMENK